IFCIINHLFNYILLLLTCIFLFYFFFFFNNTAPTEIYTLSLHDALPISCWQKLPWMQKLYEAVKDRSDVQAVSLSMDENPAIVADRKSTRLNSSHLGISYAVFCLKKKKKKKR